MITGPRIRALLLLPLVAALGCDGSSPTAMANADGSFTASVEGTTTVELSGTADFQDDASPPAFGIRLLGSDGASSILFFTDGMTRPPASDYVIESALEHGGNGPVGTFTAVLSVGTSDFYGSVTGTLDIGSSSAGQVSGTFTFSGADANDETRSVTVNGTFTATPRQFP